MIFPISPHKINIPLLSSIYNREQIEIIIKKKRKKKSSFPFQQHQNNKFFDFHLFLILFPVFSFSFLCFFFLITEPMIREKLMSGKLLINWRHDLCGEIAKERYMDMDVIQLTHTELANLFFQQETDDSGDETSSEHSQDIHNDVKMNVTGGSDISYSIRHVEESWHHLLKSGDREKLKSIAVCNFDFLLASVNSIFYFN